MINKKAALSFCALMIVASVLLSSCGLIKINYPKTDPTTDDIGTTEADKTDEVDKLTDHSKDYTEDIEAFLNVLPDRKYDGDTFVIMTSAPEIVLGREGSQIASEIQERNKTISERYGIKLVSVAESESDMLAKAKNALESDSYYADLLLLSAEGVGKFAREELLLNLRSVPFMNINEEYFYSESADASCLNHKVYGIAGHASLNRDDLPCMYFSTYRAEQLEIGDIYDLVYSGDWTWDKYFEFTSALDEYNNDRIAAGNRNIYACGTDSLKDNMAKAAFRSLGGEFVRNTGSSQELVFGTESDSERLELVRNIFADKYWIASDNVTDMFFGGEIMFFADTFGTAEKLTQSSYNWGMLPLPKYSSGDSYATYVDAAAPTMFSVMVNSVDAEKAGLIISALNAASYGRLNAAYVKYAMNYIIRDNDTANVMDMIMENISYDFADVFGEAYPTLGEGTYDLVDMYSSGEINYGDLWNEKLSLAKDALNSLK